MNYIGIDIGGTNLKAGLVDEDGRLLAVKTMKIREVVGPRRPGGHPGGADPGAGPGAAACPWRRSPPWAAGVPGAVDIRAGCHRCTPATCPCGTFPCASCSTGGWALPLYVENDANCAAAGRVLCRSGPGQQALCHHHPGHRRGRRDHPQRKDLPRRQRHGRRGGPHVHRLSGGEPCPCGRRGCWEQYASASALKRLTAQGQLAAHPDSILCPGHAGRTTAMCPASRPLWPHGGGDPVGQQVCDVYVGYLAAGIANVVNIFQPDTLAIGGGVSNESR